MRTKFYITQKSNEHQSVSDETWTKNTGVPN